MSSFQGLNTALSGLMAQRRAMEIAAQNIANQNTDGYTRQRTDLASVGGNTVPAIHSTWKGAGSGITVTGQARIRDAFLEGRSHVEGGIHAKLESADTVMTSIEQAFREPGELGLQDAMAKLFTSFGDVRNDAATTDGNLAPRNVVLGNAQGVVDALHDMDRSMSASVVAYSDKVDMLTTEVNSTAVNLAQLNGAIKQGTMAGLPVNELMDKRDVLVSKLATLIGATAKPVADGVVDVYVGAKALVTGRNAESVVVTRAAGRITGLNLASGPLVGTPVALTSGSATGLIDAVRAGGVIDSYRSRLDVVAKQLHDDVNAVHSSGYDLITPGVTAGAMFGSSGGPVTAASLTLVVTDPLGLAASDAPGPSSNVANANNLFEVGSGIDSRYRQVIADLGVEGLTSARRLDVQAGSLSLINASRESQSGVSTDEELALLLSYQRAYEAAARVMTTVDSALDTLINRTGLVGR